MSVDNSPEAGGRSNEPGEPKLAPVWGDFVETLDFDLPKVKFELSNPRRAPLPMWDSFSSLLYPAGWIRTPGSDKAIRNDEYVGYARMIANGMVRNNLGHSEKVYPGLAEEDVDTVYGRGEEIDIYDKELSRSILHLNNLILDFHINVSGWEQAQRHIPEDFRYLYEEIEEGIRRQELLIGDKVFLEGRELPTNLITQVVVMRGENATTIGGLLGDDIHMMAFADGELKLISFVELFMEGDDPTMAIMEGLRMADDLKSTYSLEQKRGMVINIDRLLDNIGASSKRMLEWLAGDEKTSVYCPRWVEQCESLLDGVILMLEEEGMGEDSTIRIACEEYGLKPGPDGDLSRVLKNYVLSKFLV